MLLAIAISKEKIEKALRIVEVCLNCPNLFLLNSQ